MFHTKKLNKIVPFLNLTVYHNFSFFTTTEQLNFSTYKNQGSKVPPIPQTYSTIFLHYATFSRPTSLKQFVSKVRRSERKIRQKTNVSSEKRSENIWELTHALFNFSSPSQKYSPICTKLFRRFYNSTFSRITIKSPPPAFFKNGRSQFYSETCTNLINL